MMIKIIGLKCPLSKSMGMQKQQEKVVSLTQVGLEPRLAVFKGIAIPIRLPVPPLAPSTNGITVVATIQ